MADKGGSGRGSVCTRAHNTACVTHSMASDVLQVTAGERVWPVQSVCVGRQRGHSGAVKSGAEPAALV